MLKVQNISFHYTKNKPVLTNFSFKVNKGEHLCIMGESGCGKSTLLKVIYGLFDLQKGTIFWNNAQITGPAENLVPGFEKFKYVAQDFDLMPYISVSENIKKFLSRFYPEESEARTQELLEVIQMKAFEHTKVKNLSGGQKQRVAIARALAKEPELLLLDEPFGQIDNFKKSGLRRKLFAYLKEKNIACIVATHDKDDALSFADKLIVIRNNSILVNNSPTSIYQNPTSRYVAALFDDVNEIVIDNQTILCYPHQLKVVENSNILVKVINSYFKGFYWLIEADFDGQIVFFNYDFRLYRGEKVNLQPFKR